MRSIHVSNFDIGEDFDEINVRGSRNTFVISVVTDDGASRHSKNEYKVEKKFWLNRKAAKKLMKELKQALKEE